MNAKCGQKFLQKQLKALENKQCDVISKDLEFLMSNQGIAYECCL